jgi:hypothetical protein
MHDDALRGRTWRDESWRERFERRDARCRVQSELHLLVVAMDPGEPPARECRHGVETELGHRDPAVVIPDDQRGLRTLLRRREVDGGHRVLVPVIEADERRAQALRDRRLEDLARRASHRPLHGDGAQRPTAREQVRDHRVRNDRLHGPLDLREIRRAHLACAAHPELLAQRMQLGRQRERSMVRRAQFVAPVNANVAVHGSIG